MDLPTPESTLHEDCERDVYDQFCDRLSSRGISPPLREEVLNLNRRPVPIEHDDAFVTRVITHFDRKIQNWEKQGRSLDGQGETFMRELNEEVAQALQRETQALEEFARKAREKYYLSSSGGLSAEEGVHWFHFLKPTPTIHSAYVVIANVLPKFLPRESTPDNLPPQENLQCHHWNPSRREILRARVAVSSRLGTPTSSEWEIDENLTREPTN